MPTKSPGIVRKLLSCPACKRQFDATAAAVGSRLRCRCGATILVPNIQPHEAAVVRCRSCGGTRAGGAAACGFCGSDFTVHEQDLHTMCPSCFARISDRAKYCHHCATPIAPEEGAGDLTDRPCPACGDDRKLSSRALGHDGLSVLECGSCAGLWVSEETFQVVRERQLQRSDPAPDPRAIRTDIEKRDPSNRTAKMYRRCPVCATMMSRFNFGRRSGVLLDRCPPHGIWFDASELDATLRWIRLGGERLTTERQEREDRERQIADRFRIEPKTPDQSWRDANDGGSPDLVHWVVGKLFGI